MAANAAFNDHRYRGFHSANHALYGNATGAFWQAPVHPPGLRGRLSRVSPKHSTTTRRPARCNSTAIRNDSSSQRRARVLLLKPAVSCSSSCLYSRSDARLHTPHRRLPRLLCFGFVAEQAKALTPRARAAGSQPTPRPFPSPASVLDSFSNRLQLQIARPLVRRAVRGQRSAETKLWVLRCYCAASLD